MKSGAAESNLPKNENDEYNVIKVDVSGPCARDCAICPKLLL